MSLVYFAESVADTVGIPRHRISAFQLAYNYQSKNMDTDYNDLVQENGGRSGDGDGDDEDDGDNDVDDDDGGHDCDGDGDDGDDEDDDGGDYIGGDDDDDDYNKTENYTDNDVDCDANIFYFPWRF